MSPVGVVFHAVLLRRISNFGFKIFCFVYEFYIRLLVTLRGYYKLCFLKVFSKICTHFLRTILVPKPCNLVHITFRILGMYLMFTVI